MWKFLSGPEPVVLFVCVLVSAAAGAHAFGEEGDISREELEQMKARLEKFEEAGIGGPLAGWFERVTLRGLLELEASYVDTDSDDPDAEGAESDVALATMAVALEVAIADWITGGIVLLWEEDDTEPVDMDVAIISIGNTERFPLYVEAGKLYPPFGNFESEFITDPVALEIGETRESAAKLGGAFGPVELSLTAFNGDVSEADEGNDHIESLVGAVSISDEAENFGLAAGASYATNLADSDGLTDQLTVANQVNDSVSGLNVWANFSACPFCLLAEYVGATQQFDAGDLAFSGGEKARPRAWNLEAALALSSALTVACKYEHAHDVYDWQPESRWGAAITYRFFEGDPAAAILSLEYLRDKFETDANDEVDSVTLQLAIEF